jgi:hypothetical protein
MNEHDLVIECISTVGQSFIHKENKENYATACFVARHDVTGKIRIYTTHFNDK